MRKIALLIGDLGLMFFVLFLALSIRKMEVVSSAYYFSNLRVFLPIFLFSLLVYILFDLYGLRLLQVIYRLVYRLFLAVLVSFVFATIYLYLFQARSEISPKTVLLLYVVLLFLLTVVWRFLYHDLFFTSKKYLRKVLIIGGEKVSRELTQLAIPPKGVDYQIIGFVSVDENFKKTPFDKLPYLGSFDDIQKIICEHEIQEVIVTFDYYDNNSNFIRVLSDTLMSGIKIFQWPVFYEQVFQKIPINEIDHFWFLYAFGETDKRFFERIKRIFDLLISLAGMVFLLLILPFIAFLIKLTSPGPVFYRQKRLGMGGEMFTLIKFRTMRNDAEKHGAVWSAKGDERVTSVGKILRKTRLDEMPQFLNILRGEMSLVGPRPERPEFLPILDEKIPFYYKRLMVKPGVTGFAQVMYPYAETVEDSVEKIGYDLFYIKNRCLYLYLKIVLLTLRTMLTFSGQ